MKQILCGLLILCTVSACSAFRDRTKIYHEAKSIAPMKIPAEYDANNMTDYYPIPALKETDAKPVDLMPPNVKS